ncbi:uncharacterized protein FTOL_13799 [Fusarium torulosum]|uniref:Uncharacterized protein n=1 Tax=Fusarium torulosum TaxID=33205 RepID=A0AAE8MPP4_9HYPO|nr:uncharacterized protein FTOL_13799 [Fusarium torulosum]
MVLIPKVSILPI